jgi:hypothetical protein
VATIQKHFGDAGLLGAADALGRQLGSAIVAGAESAVGQQIGNVLSGIGGAHPPPTGGLPTTIYPGAPGGDSGLINTYGAPGLHPGDVIVPDAIGRTIIVNGTTGNPVGYIDNSGKPKYSWPPPWGVHINPTQTGGPTPGHHSGGVVAGPTGMPVLAMIHGGERVLRVDERAEWEGGGVSGGREVQRLLERIYDRLGTLQSRVANYNLTLQGQLANDPEATRRMLQRMTYLGAAT